MIIDKIRVQNFKSISDSGYMEIHNKFNVIIGKNNSGKTAFIEAIDRCFKGTLNYPSFSSNGNEFGIQNPSTSPAFISIIIKLSEEDIHKFENFFHFSFSTGYVQFGFKCYQGLTYFEEIHITNNKSPYFTSDSFFYHSDPNSGNKVMRINNNVEAFGNRNEHSQLIESLFSDLAKRVIYISGERRVPQQQSFGFVNELDSTANNIHGFLLNLLSIEKVKFNSIIQSFITVFSEVIDISPQMQSNNTTNIHIKFKDLNEPIPIQKCGSGYYHVLVLLTLLHTKNNDFLILFDEPNSYLHPSAEKAIYDIIADQSDHQFIFTSHSPILINYPTDKIIYIAKLDRGISYYYRMEQVGEALNEIGIQNSDFAFANKIIFVEGDTEKKQLPKILKAGGMPQIGLNYSLLELYGTGNEFSNEKIMARNARVYKDLFNCISSQQVPYIFILDRDERKYEELKKSYGEDNILLLKKREFENYLLDTDAISAFLKEVFDREVSQIDIDHLIQDCLKRTNDKSLFPRGLLTNDPMSNIKGNEVLDRIIKQFINNEYTYSKPRNGAVLVDWLLTYKPTTFNEISDLLEDFIKK